MPVYEYACTECGERLEVRQSFTDDPLSECPTCAGRLRKVLSAVGVVFKGSGFYRNDSRSNGASGKDGAAAGTDGKDGKDKKDKKEPATSGAVTGSSSDSSGSSSSGSSSSGSSSTPAAASPASSS